MGSLKIELSEPLLQHVEHRAAATGVGNAGDFIRDLIERDRAATSQLELQLLEALHEGGEFVDVDDEFWDERKRELARQVAERKHV